MLQRGIRTAAAADAAKLNEEGEIPRDQGCKTNYATLVHRQPVDNVRENPTAYPLFPPLVWFGAGPPPSPPPPPPPWEQVVLL